MASCVVSIVDIKDTIKDMSTVFIQVMSLHLTWLAMTNDMATCVTNIVDVEDDISDLQLVFIQVISVHLYCWWMLLSIVSVSSLSIVNKSNVIAQTVRSTQAVYGKFSNTLTMNIFKLLWFFNKLYISPVFNHHNCNLFNGITNTCTIVLPTTVQNAMTEYISSSYIWILHFVYSSTLLTL